MAVTWEMVPAFAPIVSTTDRLSRKVRQLAAFCEELDKLGVVLKSATEPFDTGSPAGRMMLQMLGVFAEFEHATIVDRVTAGLERRVREGRWMGRRIPYGYTRDPDSKALLPCPVRAPVLRHIFALYTQERQGTTSIARTLEAEGAPPPRQHGWSPNDPRKPRLPRPDPLERQALRRPTRAIDR